MALITLESTSNGVRWTTDGQEVATAPALAAILNQLDEPSAFVCEPALFDGLRDVRHYLVEYLAESGHVLAPMTSRARAVLEQAGGAAIRGRGVVRLYALATRGATGLRPEVLQTAGLWEVRDALEVAFAADMYGDGAAARERACGAAGPYALLDADARFALGEAGDYRWDVLLAVYRAASVSTGRDDYERLLGLAAGAHGALARVIRGWYVRRNSTVEFERQSVLTWSDYRRALRTLFHAMKATRARREEIAA